MNIFRRKHHRHMPVRPARYPGNAYERAAQEFPMRLIISAVVISITGLLFWIFK